MLHMGNTGTSMALVPVITRSGRSVRLWKVGCQREKCLPCQGDGEADRRGDCERNLVYSVTPVYRKTTDNVRVGVLSEPICQRNGSPPGDPDKKSVDSLV